MASPDVSIFSPGRNRRSICGGQLRNASRDSSASDAGFPAQNDDDAEKRQRQRDRLLELQAQNLSSPATPKERRNSLGTGISGLTNSQLAEHYEDCIRLSTENKITVKNAFVLHLIDYMAEMLKNRDEPTNFQMASCTLDASTKIYAVRVDSVHNEVFKIVGHLGIADEQKRKKADDEDCGLENEQTNVKKKQKVKKSSMIEQNLKNITLQKLDLEYEADPLFQRMTSLFDEGGVGGLMVNTVRCLDDNCELILDSTVVPDQRYKNISLEPPTFIDHNDFKDLLSSIGNLSESKKICPTFEDFQFTGWSIPVEDLSQSDEMFKKPENRLDFAYRPASPGQLDDDDNDYNEMQYDDGMPLHDETTGRSVLSERRDAFANTVAQGGIRAVTLDSIDDIAQILADKPSDYSYFNNQLISAWAGPQHWKLRPSQAKAGDDQKDAEARKRTKKVPQILDYNVEIDTTVKHKKSKLPKRSAQTTDIEKTTLPEDMHYAMEDLTKFMLKTNFFVKANRRASDMAIPTEDESNYNYDNANDCGNFCPSTEESEDEGPGEDLNPTPGFDTINETCLPAEESPFPQTQLPFTGENLVQQPYKIDKINIRYARTAKKIDVRKLKKTIWNVLSKKDEQSWNAETRKMEDEMKFSELYNSLPSRISEMSARDLSVPIAFVCFLHIVNEQNLSLESQDDLSDFTIRQA